MSSSPPTESNRNTIVVGISGPSSSGKTTLARLLRTVFTPERNAGCGLAEGDIKDRKDIDRHKKSDRDEEELRVFIIHEDDFYKPDDQIPVTTTAAGKRVQDWDTIGALDVRQLTSALSYVRARGTLPPRLKSKEDLNEVKDSGVTEDSIRRIRGEVARRLEGILSSGREARGKGLSLSLAFLEGFLLYAPAGDEKHALRAVHDNIHVPLFLPATYSVLKERREGRTGYVTIGPAPTPELDEEKEEKRHGAAESDDKSLGDGNGEGEGEDGGIGDLEEDGDPFPHQNFWTDPPGYVDDIVWPRYIADHAWLLLTDPGTKRSEEELKEAVGEGRDVKEDAGVLVAPGKGAADLTELLEWGVREVLKEVERVVAGGV
ncbi:hypothetical protein AJ79_08804 [Helicocarpus griseus UAMH5409]|uniref:Nicotinamide riboside kinase n=1 Tax=Helicocarpus griseus UAMH5409 TaxID=1447875 RepID=A0A2B7WQ14_9EURO|nr:hypothetical protein AJ79_08804 [Helicocarpus griseus UAMH5409]